MAANANQPKSLYGNNCYMITITIVISLKATDHIKLKMQMLGTSLPLTGCVI
jgi:hypothetical protein